MRRGPGRAVAVQAAVVVSGVAARLLAVHAGVAARAGTALVLQAGAAIQAEQLVVVTHVGCGAEGQLTRVGTRPTPHVAASATGMCEPLGPWPGLRVCVKVQGTLGAKRP